MDEREKERLWRDYQQGIFSGSLHSLQDWGVAVGPITTFILTGHPKWEKEAEDRANRLLAAWKRQHESKTAPQNETEKTDERKIFDLCLEFLEAADKVRPQRIDELLEAGVPVNFQHPRYLETALHITCSRNAANALTERLLACPGIDLLIRDQFGRQPWNNAELFGIDPALAERVLDATLEQLEKEQLSRDDFERDYREYLSSWMSQEWYFHLARHNQFKPEP